MGKRSFVSRTLLALPCVTGIKNAVAEFSQTLLVFFVHSEV